MRQAWMRLGLCLLGALCACGPGLSQPPPLPPENPDTEVPQPHIPPVMLPPISVGEVAVVDAIFAELSVQVLGSGFSSRCVAYLDNQALQTRFVSGTELRVTIPRMLRAQPTPSLLEVRIPPSTPGFPGGARSPFARVIDPTPILFALHPRTLESEPSEPVRVIVSGENLVNGSEVVFRGGRYPLVLTTPFEGTVELPPAALGATPEQTLLHVELRGRPDLTTAALPLTVSSPTPTLIGVWPPSLNAVDLHQGKAGPAKTDALLVRGAHLRANTVVKWNGRPLVTTRQADGKHLRAELPLEARQEATTISLTLESPSAQGPMTSASHPLPVRTAPVLYSLSPPWVRVRSTNTSLELRGEGFGERGQQTVLWNGTPLGPESFSERTDAGVWTLQVPDALLTQPGVISLQVKRTFDGAESTPLFVQVVEESPAPFASSLEPSVLAVGDAPGELHIEGDSFTAQSVVLVDGEARPTRVLSASKLSTDLIPWDVERAGVRTVTVRTPAPGGGTSLPLLLAVHVQRPMPSIEAIQGPEGGETFPVREAPVRIKLLGQGFSPVSVVRWDGQALPTQWRCASTPCMAGAGERSLLEADIPAELARTRGAVRVTVFTPGPGGGESRARSLVLTSGLEPTLSLQPGNLDVGASSATRDGVVRFTLANTGESALSSLFVNGVERPILGGNTFLLSPAERNTEGILEVHGYVAGRKSAPVYLYIHAARIPRLLALSPGVLSQGAAWTRNAQQDFQLQGQDFFWAPESERASRATVGLGPYSLPLRQSPPSSDGRFSAYLLTVDGPGVRDVTVSRIAEGGGVSPAALLNVVSERPAPLLTKLEPMTATVGAPLLKLRVHGKRFHPSSLLHWKGLKMSLEPVAGAHDADVFEVDLPASAVAEPGVVEVTIETPPPGGGTSLPIRVVVE
ncbi:cell surface receptor IPT/TIG domain protein [Myxococcus stipitatus DSM 14675]|uniref:Cell surface receptor IPT/TIG domain protein n=2 Tax=Myxococcus stipitatus TaxID=83455 RepID=L7TYQ2_MYXSD|nr:cell surface receptor IPT/TIG domain protein [Myxococcus stipitatus DSM 14675]